MGLFETQDANDAEFVGPEPPPVGSVAYRRVILKICAGWDSREYEAAMHPVFEWRGWRAAVEVMCELIGAASINVPGSAVDAFGNVKLDSLVDVMDDEEILREAHRVAPKVHPTLPRHEALAESIREGEEMRGLILDLVPTWNEAATVLRGATHMADVDPARVLFTRWLNTYDNRVTVSIIAAATTHAYWRRRVLPPGDGWVESMLNEGPDVSGSLAWGRQAGLDDLRRQQPDLVNNWVRKAAPMVWRTTPAKKRKGCCPNCGNKKH